MHQRRQQQRTPVDCELSSGWERRLVCQETECSAGVFGSRMVFLAPNLETAFSIQSAAIFLHAG
jgi:hypothetical protein